MPRLACIDTGAAILQNPQRGDVRPLMTLEQAGYPCRQVEAPPSCRLTASAGRIANALSLSGKPPSRGVAAEASSRFDPPELCRGVLWRSCQRQLQSVAVGVIQPGQSRLVDMVLPHNNCWVAVDIRLIRRHQPKGPRSPDHLG